MESQLKLKIGEELYTACVENQLDAVEALVNRNQAESAEYVPPLSTMMEAAATWDAVNVVKWCLEQGGDGFHCRQRLLCQLLFSLRKPDERRWCSYCSRKVDEVGVEDPQDESSRESIGTSLHKAIEGGHIETVDRLWCQHTSQGCARQNAWSPASNASRSRYLIDFEMVRCETNMRFRQ